MTFLSQKSLCFYIRKEEKMKRKVAGCVLRNEEIAPDIYSVWIETDLAMDANPGQFVGVYPNKDSLLLPRPISICEVDKKSSALRLVYRTVGKGTSELSHLKSGRRVNLLGVLGNGYDLTKGEEKHVILMAGGIGVPPIVELAKQLSGRADGEEKAPVSSEISIVVGYRDARTFLLEELQQYGNVYVATEDGSLGTKGNVMNAIDANKLNGDVIFACGPMPMLRAIKNYAEDKGIDAYISLEERMACGVGACLGCVCKTTKVDHHSHVNNARICTDGPVFEAKEVDI